MAQGKKTTANLVYRMMLDGSRTGLGLAADQQGLNIPIVGKNVTRISRLMRKCPREVRTDTNLETIIHVPPCGGSTGMNLVLRKDIQKEGKYYLNLDGNPTTFFRANNDYGTPHTQQVVDAFWQAILFVERVSAYAKGFPKKLREDIQNRNIQVNSLEFAMYTNKLRDPLTLIKAWRWIYSMPYHKENGEFCHLSQLIPGVRFVPVENGMSEPVWDEFRIWTRSGGRNIDRMFCAYYKADQIEQVQERVAPSDLDGRIRIDLGLTYTWFHDRRIRTIQDLERYVERMQGWDSLLLAETEKVIDRACLKYMAEITDDEQTWTRRGVIGDDAHEQILHARKSMLIPTRKIREMLRNGRAAEYAELYNSERTESALASARVLSLDLSAV